MTGSDYRQQAGAWARVARGLIAAFDIAGLARDAAQPG